MVIEPLYYSEIVGDRFLRNKFYDQFFDGDKKSIVRNGCRYFLIFPVEFLPQCTAFLVEPA